ncbi:hypothetical protein BV20DRAFT_858445 [Pilatotrama ljubarskyi]|nr:hypothetical protein BV20DRAFT_858445 [Pilatotrama ljubarskyi]
MRRTRQKLDERTKQRRQYRTGHVVCCSPMGPGPVLAACVRGTRTLRSQGHGWQASNRWTHKAERWHALPLLARAFQGAPLPLRLLRQTMSDVQRDHRRSDGEAELPVLIPSRSTAQPSRRSPQSFQPYRLLRLETAYQKILVTLGTRRPTTRRTAGRTLRRHQGRRGGRHAPCPRRRNAQSSAPRFPALLRAPLRPFLPKPRRWQTR